MKSLHRKGEGTNSFGFIIGLILGLLVLGAAIYFLITGGVFGRENINNVVACKDTQGIAGIIGGYGQCKPTCAVGELSIYNKDCDKKTPKMTCCVNTERDSDSGSSSGNRGGDENTDFTIEFIGPAISTSALQARGCQPQQGKDTQLVCTPNKELTIPIKIKVTNGKTPLTILPVLDITDLSGMYGQFKVTGSPLSFAAEESKELSAELQLAKDADGRYTTAPGIAYAIKPAAQTTDGNIYRVSNDGDSMSVSFIK